MLDRPAPSSIAAALHEKIVDDDDENESNLNQVIAVWDNNSNAELPRRNDLFFLSKMKVDPPKKCDMARFMLSLS